MLLPSEIKLSIADYLDPISSNNFGTTCKEHWKLCRPLFKKHSRAFAEAPIVGVHDTLGLLKDIIHDPSKGWYINEVSLTANWDVPLPVPIEGVEQLQEAAKDLLRLYPRSNMIDEDDDCLIQRIMDGIVTGYPDGMIAVLIHHLPNLKTFRLTMSRESNVLNPLFNRIAVEYANLAKRPNLPFQRLHMVSVCHYDTESCMSADWALPFLHIPSLRIFAANMMGGNLSWSEGSSRGVPFYPHPQSDIEEFFFVGCQFDVAVIEYMLSCTRVLKRFTYDAGGMIVDESPYDAKLVLKALAEHTRHSLESLVLSHHSYSEEEDMFHGCDSAAETPTEADLSMFTRLHSISADWAMLWPDLSLETSASDDGTNNPNPAMLCKPLDIRDILPSSLIALHLSGVFNKEEWNGVVEPLGTPNDQTPNLTLEGVRVEGRVHNRDINTEHEPTTVDGWEDFDEDRVFGGDEKTWLERVWAPMALFQGHGW